MKKAGLQKQIAFIFDGSDQPAVLNKPVVAAEPQAQQPIAIQSEMPASPLLSNITAQTVPVQPQTAKSAPRPKPIPKDTFHKQESITLKKITGYLKKQMLGSQAKSLDAHQKKMTILVGILSIVLVGILVAVLGGGPAKARAAVVPSELQTEAAVEITDNTTNIWEIPDAWPSVLRDPLQLPSKQVAENSGAASALVVRGIVYSQSNPTAIISGQIVSEGQIIDGIKIVKIAKEYVEFQKDQKCWTQQVEQK